LCDVPPFLPQLCPRTWFIFTYLTNYADLEHIIEPDTTPDAADDPQNDPRWTLMLDHDVDASGALAGHGKEDRGRKVQDDARLSLMLALLFVPHAAAAFWLLGFVDTDPVLISMVATAALVAQLKEVLDLYNALSSDDYVAMEDKRRFLVWWLSGVGVCVSVMKVFPVLPASLIDASFYATITLGLIVALDELFTLVPIAVRAEVMMCRSKAREMRQLRREEIDRQAELQQTASYESVAPGTPSVGGIRRLPATFSRRDVSNLKGGTGLADSGKGAAFQPGQFAGHNDADEAPKLGRVPRRQAGPSGDSDDDTPPPLGPAQSGSSHVAFGSDGPSVGMGLGPVLAAPRPMFGDLQSGGGLGPAPGLGSTKPKPSVWGDLDDDEELPPGIGLGPVSAAPRPVFGDLQSGGGLGPAPGLGSTKPKPAVWGDLDEDYIQRGIGLHPDTADLRRDPGSTAGPFQGAAGDSDDDTPPPLGPAQSGSSHVAFSSDGPSVGMGLGPVPAAPRPMFGDLQSGGGLGPAPGLGSTKPKPSVWGDLDDDEELPPGIGLGPVPAAPRPAFDDLQSGGGLGPAPGLGSAKPKPSVCGDLDDDEELPPGIGLGPVPEPSSSNPFGALGSGHDVRRARSHEFRTMGEEAEAAAPPPYPVASDAAPEAAGIPPRGVRRGHHAAASDADAAEASARSGDGGLSGQGPRLRQTRTETAAREGIAGLEPGLAE